MIIDCKKGKYIVETNFRDAFRLDVFEEKYIEECFDKYIYIVGDISASHIDELISSNDTE